MSDPVRDAYAAHLGAIDGELAPPSARLAALGFDGTLVRGARFAGTIGLCRKDEARAPKQATYEVALLHDTGEPSVAWPAALLWALVEIERTRVPDGKVLDLLAQHGGVTAGPFALGKKEVGVLLVDGPPLLPWRVEVAGRGVRLLRAVTLELAELQYAADRGVPALVARLVDLLTASVSQPGRRSLV
jgi:hypothetical protein